MAASIHIDISSDGAPEFSPKRTRSIPASIAGITPIRFTRLLLNDFSFRVRNLANLTGMKAAMVCSIC